jgi:hypothetical protein
MVAGDPFSRATNDPIGLGRYSPQIRDAIASAEYAPNLDTQTVRDYAAQHVGMPAHPEANLSEVEKHTNLFYYPK